MREPKILIPADMTPPLCPILVSDITGLTQVAKFLDSVTEFTFDVETNVTPHYYNRKIRTIQIGNKQEQYIIDLFELAGRSSEVTTASQGNYGAAAELVYGPVIALLEKYLDSDKWLKVGTNIQFDYEMMKWNLGVRMWHLYDTLLAEKILYAGEVHYMASGFWALDDQVRRYCGLIISKDEQKGFDMETPLTQSQIEYCGVDVRLPLAVMSAQCVRLHKEGLMDVALIEFDAIPAFGDIYLNGLKVDIDEWQAIIDGTLIRQAFIVGRLDSHFIPVVGTKDISDVDVQQRDDLEKKWREEETDKVKRKEYRMAFMAKRKSITDRVKDCVKCEGEAFINYASPTQLKMAMWKMGYTKTTLPDTSDVTLEALATPEVAKWDVNEAFEKDPQLEKFSLIDLIRLGRSTKKQLTTYGYAWITVGPFVELDGKKKNGHVLEFDGRIHSKLNQIGAATGRTSSTKPNVQNIPKGSAYRFAFKSRPGYKFVTVDMSGAELRILAEMSGEPVWVKAFNSGWDVHSVCAEIIFEQEWIDATEEGCKFASSKHKCKCKEHKKLRDICKTLNFGLAYGMGPKRLAEQVGITKDHAILIFDKFKRAFPIVFSFLERLGQEAVMNLEARDIAGRRRKWRRPNSEDAKRLAQEDCDDKLKTNKNAAKAPTNDQIRKKLKGLYGSIEREGKNCPIQGSNATFIKLAMGSGQDGDGKSFLWHVLEPLGGLMVNMIHDELCVEVPDEHADEVLAAVGSAMTRASARYLKSLVMEVEGSIDIKWSK